MRIVEIDNPLHEVGAIALEQFVALAVGPGVEKLNQSVVLLGGGRKTKTVKGPVIGRPGKLIAWLRACSLLRRKRQSGKIAFAQECDQLGIYKQRDVLDIVDSVQIRHQGNRQPVMAGDAVIAAENHAELPGMATAQ